MGVRHKWLKPRSWIFLQLFKMMFNSFSENLKNVACKIFHLWPQKGQKFSPKKESFDTPLSLFLRTSNSWKILYWVHLNNYFDFHVCLSIRPSVRSSVRVCVRKIAPFPAVLWQNVTNKSCLVCVKSEKYVVWVTLRFLGSMRQGEDELRTL